LVRGDVVVTATEGEQQVVGRGDLEVLAARSLGVGLCLTETGYVDDLLEAPATLAVTALGKAEPVRAVRPHPVAHVETGGHVRLQLPDALGAVSGLDVSPLGLDEDVGVRLSMVGALVEDDDVRTFTRGTDPDSELRS